jgi:hypothetical protein
MVFHSTTTGDHSQTSPGIMPPIDEYFSQACLSLVQTYHEGKRSKSNTIKCLTDLVTDELPRAGDDINIKMVTSVLCGYLEILTEFDNERAGARQEAIDAMEDWVRKAKRQVAATQKRGRDDEGEPDKHSIDLELIPFGKPDSVKPPDDLRLTLELQDNYRRDLAYAKTILLGDQSRPEFPPNLWEDVLTNRFIDFNQIFRQTYYPVEKCDNRRINEPYDWVYTWDKYQKAGPRTSRRLCFARTLHAC